MPVVGLLILAYSGCNVLLSVVVLTLSVTMIGAVTSGFFQTPMDIAPNFAGKLRGRNNNFFSAYHKGVFPLRSQKTIIEENNN